MSNPVPGSEQRLPDKNREQNSHQPENEIKPADFLVEKETNEELQKKIKHEEGFLDDTIAKMRGLLRSTKQKPVIMPKVRDDITLKIEHIMEAVLGDAFNVLTPLQQQEFKLKGEQTASLIRELLQQTKIKVKKIFALLVGWLRFLPGIDRFFLEQEAKIKTDQIIALSRQNKKL